MVVGKEESASFELGMGCRVASDDDVAVAKPEIDCGVAAGGDAADVVWHEATAVTMGHNCGESSPRATAGVKLPAGDG